MRTKSAPFFCPKCNATIVEMSQTMHLALAHQMATSIRFKGRGEREMKVERSRETGLFDCPRCSASFQSPRALQGHAAKDCHNFMPASSRVSTNMSNVPLKAPKSISGRSRARRVAAGMSRTHRAIARQMYAEELYTNQEIADFLKCDTQDVHRAIHNESNDNVDSDALYTEGRRGDLINIDRYQAPDNAVVAFRPEDMDAIEVDEKLVLAEEYVIGDKEENNQGYDSELEIETYYMHSPRTSDLESPPTSPRLLRAQRNKIVPRNNDEPQSPPLPPVTAPESSTTSLRTAPTNFDHNAMSRTSSRTASSSFGERPTASTSTNVTTPSMSPSNYDDPVEVFLSGLKRPCVHLADRFKSYGVATAEDLDALCGMQEYWADVEQYFLRQGLTPFEWLMVQEGLKARAARLSAGRA